MVAGIPSQVARVTAPAPVHCTDFLHPGLPVHRDQPTQTQGASVEALGCMHHLPACIHVCGQARVHCMIAFARLPRRWDHSVGTNLHELLVATTCMVPIVRLLSMSGKMTAMSMLPRLDTCSTRYDLPGLFGLAIDRGLQETCAAGILYRLIKVPTPLAVCNRAPGACILGVVCGPFLAVCAALQRQRDQHARRRHVFRLS